jgi:hypothetical protein
MSLLVHPCLIYSPIEASKRCFVIIPDISGRTSLSVIEDKYMGATCFRNKDQGDKDPIPLAAYVYCGRVIMKK